MTIWQTFSHHIYQSINSMQTIKIPKSIFIEIENNSYRIVKDYEALLIDQSSERITFEGSNIFTSKHITKLN